MSHSLLQEISAGDLYSLAIPMKTITVTTEHPTAEGTVILKWLIFSPSKSRVPGQIFHSSNLLDETLNRGQISKL